MWVRPEAARGLQSWAVNPASVVLEDFCVSRDVVSSPGGQHEQENYKCNPPAQRKGRNKASCLCLCTVGPLMWPVLSSGLSYV